MKIAATILGAMIAISGLVLAASDAGSFGAQIITSTAGVCIMILGGLWLINILGSEL